MWGETGRWRRWFARIVVASVVVAGVAFWVAMVAELVVKGVSCGRVTVVWL